MEEKKVVNLTYKQPKLSRVFSAHLFDFFSAVVIGIIFISLSVILLHVTPLYTNNKSKQKDIQIQSRLYVESDSNTTLITDKLSSDDTLKTSEKIDQLSSSLTYFFDEFLTSNTSLKNSKETYTNLLVNYVDSSNRNLFDSNRNRIYTNADEDNTYLTAYSSITTKYAIGYLSYVNGYSNLRKNLVIMTIITIMIGLSLSLMVVYLVLPLIFKRGRKTLGFKLNKIGYVSLDGYSPSVLKIIFKFIFQWILVYIASFFTFGIPLFISVGMMFLSKRHQTLSDYIFGVILVDTDIDTIYLDYIDYRTAHVFDSNIDVEPNEIEKN